METVEIQSGGGSQDTQNNHPEEATSEVRLNADEVVSRKPLMPDGGYGWVVVAATFVIYAIAEGITFAFGLLFIEFLSEFKGSKSATSWIGSLFVALPLVSGPIASALVTKYGCQKMTILGSALTAAGVALGSQVNSLGLLYLTFGVIGGLARSLCYITVTVSVTYWFEKKRSVALGISASGTGFGTIVFSPITEYLLREFGWRGTMMILGGFLANMCVCGALMIDPKWRVKEELQKKRELKRQSEQIQLRELNRTLETNEDNNETASLFEHNRTAKSIEPPKKKWYDDFLEIINIVSSFKLLLDLHFLLLALTILFAGTWFLIPYFYLADHMIPHGYEEYQASNAISVIGLANITGMILLGWIGDRWNVSKLFAISLILCGASIWGIIFFTNNYYLLLVCAAAFGFFFASCFSLSPSLLSELISLDDFTVGYGLILFCEGCGHLLGPPLAGYISDVTKSWSQSFYQAGLWIMIAGVLVGLIPFTKNRRLFSRR